MKNSLKILLMIILSVSFAACTLPSRPTTTPGINMEEAATIVSMTLQALNTPTPENTAVISPSPIFITQTNTPAPTTLLTPTATITPTYSVPLFSFSVNTNCRQGPGVKYRVVSLLQAGTQIEGIGTQGNYWIVKDSKANICWVPKDLASASGSTWSLPTVPAPTPQASDFPPAPSWANYDYTCGAINDDNTMPMTVVLKWIDRAIDETSFKVYRNETLITVLDAGSTSYTDITSVISGKGLSYYVEIYNDIGHAKSPTISVTCP